MYDASNEPHEFVGADRDEAVAKACHFFRLDLDALAVHELVPAEVYGLGGRTVIVAAPLDRKAPPRDARGRGPGGGEEGRSGRRGRDGGRERGGRGDEREGRGDRGGDRGGRGPEMRNGRGRGGDRDRGGDRERSADRDRGGDRSEARGGRRGEPSREEDAEPRREPLPDPGPSVGTTTGDLGEIGRVVLGTVERMGLGPFVISEGGEPGLVIISLRGPAALALGRGDGRPVDALQLLANQAAMRLNEESDRIVLDVEGDVEEREVRLGELAERAARRARETGRAIALDPMSPRDRRAVHLALRDAQGIATMSVGESRYRQVVVVPEGAPEYQEALREAQAAAQAAEGD